MYSKRHVAIVTFTCPHLNLNFDSSRPQRKQSEADILAAGKKRIAQDLVTHTYSTFKINGEIVRLRFP